MKFTVRFLFVSFVVLFGGFFVGVNQARATGCSQDIPFEYNSNIENSIFDNFESAEYINGYLTLHFRLTRAPIAYEQWLPRFYFLNDQCQEVYSWISGYVYKFDQYPPQTTRNISLHFLSATGWYWWDDDLNTSLQGCWHCSGDIPIEYRNHKLRVGNSILLGTTLLGEIKSSAHFIKERHDPVIIIPGILGSWEKDGEMVIDPVLYTYDDLIETLEANGYTKDIDLFTFPYEWRNSNVDTAVALRDKINAVQDICNCLKVNLVAHSMGGLVARQYIQSGDYQGDVDKLIFLGTPHLGSPKAYLMWEGGEFGPNAKDSIIEFIFSREAKKAGYDNLFEYIRNKVPSVQQLLPITDYLRDKDTGNLRSFPVDYPQNNFIANLVEGTSAFLSSGVQISNFVGNMGPASTIETIRVVPSVNLPLWEHGYPENFDNENTDRGLEFGSGDQTVPLDSASYIDVDLNDLDAEHSQLVTMAEGMVFKKLTGKDPTVLIDADRGKGYKLIIIKILSPADIQVIAPDGKRVGKNFATGQEINEIHDSFYSGFLTDNEYITILNPLDGEYKVQTLGTGTGEYTVATGFITDATLADHDFTANTIPGATNEIIVTVDNTHPEEIIVTPSDITPPTIIISVPTTIDTARTGLMDIRSTVTDSSGVATISHSFDGRRVSAPMDLFYEKLGPHTVTVSATDTVNNTASKSVSFNLIATFDSGIENTNQAFGLGWIKSKSVKNSIINKFETARDNIRRRATVLASLSSYLDTQFKKKAINQQAYDILKEDVLWLQTH